MLIVLGKTVPLARRWVRKESGLCGDFKVVSPATTSRVRGLDASSLIVPAGAWGHPGRGLTPEEAETLLQCFVKRSSQTVREVSELLKNCLERDSRIFISS